MFTMHDGYTRLAGDESFYRKKGRNMDVGLWILFGLGVGVMANLLDPKQTEGGFGATMMLGIIGALCGGAIANLIFGLGITGINLTSLSVGIAGSLILLLAGRIVLKN